MQISVFLLFYLLQSKPTNIFDQNDEKKNKGNHEATKTYSRILFLEYQILYRKLTFFPFTTNLRQRNQETFFLSTIYTIRKLNKKETQETNKVALEPRMDEFT